ncbi:MAG: hypothetical protein A3G20_02495 [Acidobacteria bacterium RIFCSPLOWO2_12_FULL_59_11]|nr:MAG: hypothetical protein A3G20_02495 [Acidobacteria bacterium RIFCSPLOWO2_12_FULL_59_11]
MQPAIGSRFYAQRPCQVKLMCSFRRLVAILLIMDQQEGERPRSTMGNFLIVNFKESDAPGVSLKIRLDGMVLKMVRS